MTDPRPVRLPGVAESDWSEETHRIFDGTVATGRSRPLHLPAVVAHQPSLLAAYIEWAKAIALDGILPRRTAAMLALRTAWGLGSEFEWGVHADRATVGGLLTEAEIAAVSEGPEASAWSAVESAILTAADELVLTGTLSDATWADLEEELDAAALVEVCLTVGHYSMLSMLANSVGLEGEPWWADLGKAPPRQAS